jgi:hypothetical protein
MPGSMRPPQNAAMADALTSPPILRRRILTLLPFLLASFFVIKNVVTWPARISYPGDEAYEGVPLADMIRLRAGAPIYAANATDTFSQPNFGPLYYLLAEHLIDPARPSYVPLRLLSALAMLGCAACCALLAFWLTGSQLAVWLSPLAFFGYGMVTGHGILALSDGVAVFLAVLGFLVAYRLRVNSKILLAAPIMILSFFYKPQYIAGPAAVLLFFVLEKRYKLVAEFTGLLAGGGLALLAFFQWIVFPGQAFVRHFLFSEAPLLSWQLAGRALFSFALLFAIPVFMAMAYLRKHPHKLIASYVVCASFLGLLTMAKGGSNLHYFFELLFISSTLVAALLAERMTQRIYPFDLLLLFAVTLVAGQWLTVAPPRPSDFARHFAMQTFLRQNFPAHALAIGTTPGDLVQAGLDVPYTSLFKLAQLAHRGLVSDGALTTQIHDRRLAVIVLNVDTERETEPYWLNFYLTPSVLAAIRASYQLDTSLDMPEPLKIRNQDRFYIYVPRKD